MGALAGAVVVGAGSSLAGCFTSNAPSGGIPTPDSGFPDGTLDAAMDAGAAADGIGEAAGGRLDAGSNDAGASDTSISDGSVGDASFACVQPANPAPVVVHTVVCGAPPPFTGGTIADGTYYMTTSINYREGDAQCTPGYPSQSTVVFANGMVSLVGKNELPDGATGISDFWYVGPYTTSGSSLILGTACADGGFGSGQSFSYSATPTTLTTGLAVSAGEDVGISTKQ
jgi:hypothetical protein